METLNGKVAIVTGGATLIGEAVVGRLVAAGAKVLPFPKAVMDLAFKESMALYAELNDTNPAWKKIYGDYAAFRKDANLWARFTEATFDRYMQSAKL